MVEEAEKLLGGLTRSEKAQLLQWIVRDLGEAFPGIESRHNKLLSDPVWALMNHLPMFCQCQHTSLETAQWLEERVVNIPSSIRR